MNKKNIAKTITDTTAKVKYVTTLIDMLTWVRENRADYVKEVAEDYLHRTKGSTLMVANWHHDINWSEDPKAEAVHRRLFEVRIYDDAIFNKKTLERRLQSFTDNIVDSKVLSADIINDVKSGRYTIATFRCGRVRIILVQVG